MQNDENCCDMSLFKIFCGPKHNLYPPYLFPLHLTDISLILCLYLIGNHRICLYLTYTSLMPHLYLPHFIYLYLAYTLLIPCLYFACTSLLLHLYFDYYTWCILCLIKFWICIKEWISNIDNNNTNKNTKNTNCNIFLHAHSAFEKKCKCEHKISNFKNIVPSCMISSVVLAPV